MKLRIRNCYSLNMQLLFITPYKTTAVDNISSVMLPGSAGSFTVLHNHAPLITTLTKGLVHYKQGNETKERPIESGVAQVDHDVIKIITNL